MKGFILVSGIAVAAAFAATAQTQNAPAIGQGQWAQRAPLPSTWTEIVSAAAGGKLYAFSAGFPEKCETLEYDPAADRWRTRAPMPIGMDHVGAAVLDGKIYIVGGFTKNRHQEVSSNVFAYDPAGDSWRKLAPLPSARGSVAVDVLEGKLHAFGGRKNETDVVATHELYDPATDLWSSAPPLPRGRDHMAAVTANGKIHVVAGRFGPNEDMTGLHDIFDPATNGFSSGPLMPTPRGGGSGTLYRGLIVYLGGEDDVRTYKENEAFDVSGGRWVTLAPMPEGRHGLGVSAIGDTLYVVGGGKGRGNRGVSNELLAFTMQ